MHALLTRGSMELSTPADISSAQDYEDCASELTEEEKTSDLESVPYGIQIGLFAGPAAEEEAACLGGTAGYVDALCLLIQKSGSPPPVPYVDALSAMIASAHAAETQSGPPRSESRTGELENGTAGPDGPVAMLPYDAPSTFPLFPPSVQRVESERDERLDASTSSSDSESDSDRSSQFGTPEQRESPALVMFASLPLGAGVADEGGGVDTDVGMAQGENSEVNGVSPPAATTAVTTTAAAIASAAHVSSPASVKRSVRRVESKLSVKSQNSPGNGAAFSKPKATY